VISATLSPTRLIAQISDLHIVPAGVRVNGRVDTARALELCLASLATLPRLPDVLLATGDLADTADPMAYAILARKFAALPMPVWMIPGNHDVRATLRAAFPKRPELNRADGFMHFVIEGAPRIVMLDTIIEGTAGGTLCSERLQWLDRQLALAPSAPTIIAMHHPPFPTFIPFMDRIGLDNPAELAGIMRRNPQICAIICGHVHRVVHARFPNEPGGVPVSICPSPAHQVTLEFGDDAADSYVMEPPGFQLHAWHPQTGLVTHTMPLGVFPGPFLYPG